MPLDGIPVPLAPAPAPSRRPLWAIIGALGLVVALLAANAIARARFAHLRAVALAQWQQQLTANAELTSSVIDAWLDERRIDAREASGYVAAYAELEGASVHAPDRAVAKTAAHSALVWALTTLRRRHSYQSVWAVDDSGRVIAAADGSDTLTDDEHHAATDMRRARRERIVGPELLPSGNARLSLIMPVAGTAWSTVVAISPGPALFPYVMRETGGTATARTKLIGRDATDSMRYRVLSPSAYPPSEPFGLSVRREAAPLVWILAAHGVGTAGLFTDIRGGRIVAATTHVPGAGWAVVRAIDEDE